MSKKQEDFVHLHVHSDHSQLDGCGKISSYVEEAKKRGSPAISITEHGSMRGYFKQHKSCEEHDLKPIYGIEFYVSNDMYRRGLTDMEKFDVTKGLKKNEQKVAIKKYEEEEGIRDRWHLTAWARNDKGLKNLFRLSTMAYTEGFYYKPRIDINALIKHGEGISIGTGCASSVIHDRVVQGKKRKAFEIADQLRDKFGENLWLEIQPHDLDIQVATNQFNLELKERWGKHARLLATQDAHYVHSGDSIHHEVLLCVGTRDVLSNPNRFKFDGTDFFLKTRKQMRKTFLKNHPYMTKKQIKESLDSTVMFSEQVDAKVNIDYHAALLPHVVVPKKFSSEWEYLKSLCSIGWKRREMATRIAATGERLGMTYSDSKKMYLKRLAYELSTLKRQNFISYFLIVHDLYDWTRDNGIMAGPGRGSVAGSLVAFLLGFTCVDPLEHDLIFERFINSDRIDLPDIDMDFEDARRQEILDYLRTKYGSENVAQIATIGRLSGKQCLKDVSRVLGVPYMEAQEVTGSLIEIEGKKDDDEGILERAFSEVKVCRDFDKKYPNVLRHSLVLEGLAKTLGIHAAGIVVTPDRVENYVPLEIRKYKGQNVVVTALDKKGVAAMGLVKLDVLGLKILTVFRDCIEAIRDNKGVEVELEKIPLDDEEVLKLFTQQNFSGVFQYDTNSMLKASAGVNFSAFSDIVALNALNRPGTMRSGLTEQYVARKKNPKLTKKHLFNEKVSEITSDSLGIIVYQEHVIRIFVELAGYEPSEADKIRKIIGGSEGDEKINEEREKFVKGAKKHSGIPKEEAEKIMNAVVRFGSYSFNKSHATAYAMNAYWGQWLKLYYPLEYYWALMKNEKQPTKVQAIAKDAKKIGIKILSPDVSISAKSFSIDKEQQAILGSLTDIKGVGDAAAETIFKNQPYRNFIQFLKKIDRRKCHRGVVVVLAKSGALDGLLPNVKWFLENVDEYWEKINKKGLDSREIRIDLLKSAKEDRFTKEEKQLTCISVNPIAFGSHPLEVYEKSIKRNIKVKIVKAEREDFFKKYNSKTIFLVGIIQKKKISRIGDFHTGPVPNESRRKKMFWGSQTASIFIEGSDNSHSRIKFDRDVFDEMLPVIDAGDGAAVLVSVSVNNEYKLLRANFAIDLEVLRKKIIKKDELTLWEKIVCGKHPALSYPWPSDKTKKKRIENLGFKNKRKNFIFCGVVTNVKIKYDKRGLEMAFFGLQGLDVHLEVVCFSSTWILAKKAIKAKRLLLVQLQRSPGPKGVSYFFNGGTIKVLKKSSLSH